MSVSANTPASGFPNANTPAPVAGNTTADDEKSVDETLEVSKTAGQQISDAKHQLNAQIVRASLAVSISAQDEPLSLVYKAAIENLNEVLAPDFGENAIQNAASDDFSPEAVSTRILSFVATIYEMFRTQNTPKDATVEEENNNLDRFMGLISEGINKGFHEARGILSGLQVLKGDIAGNIDKTYDLIQKGLAEFDAFYRKSSDKQDEATDAAKKEVDAKGSNTTSNKTVG
jgi:hypothetical protein